MANGTALVLKHTPAFLDRTWQSMDAVAQTSIEKALEVCPLIRNSAPLGPYSRSMRRALRWS